MSEKFLIDTNSFITPDKTYYAPDIVPSFWTKLEDVLSHYQDEVAILDMVADELLKGNDALKVWFQNLKNAGNVQIISHADLLVIMNYQKIIQYLEDSKLYTEAAVRKWSQDGIADPWLIAAGMAYGYNIVTFEKPSGPIITPSRNPKIPTVANQFGVQCVDLYAFMRHYEFRL